MRKPGVQEFKFGRYSTEDERLRHFTTTRSKRSVYRQPNKSSQESGNRKYLELLFDVDTG
jgi:hypothetical protein